jgi:hydroxymethylbilane synthase
MKDLPTQLPKGLEIVATSIREDVRDVVCLSEHALARGIKSIDQAKIIATSSLRRVAQLKRQYPDAEFIDMRGNLQTRFKKLDENNIDAMILAAAGLHRLGMESRISQYLDPKTILPAVGQGALGIEIASARDDLKELLREALNSSEDELAIKSERAFLRTLEGGCQVPIGAYTEIGIGSIKLTGVVVSLDGSECIQESIFGNLDQAEKLGYELGYRVMKAGAGEILRGIRVG